MGERSAREKEKDGERKTELEGKVSKNRAKMHKRRGGRKE